MNIKVLDSWLREYVKTKATPQQLAEVMSLTSVGIERIEPFGKDWVYDIEVTTNRPDLMSVIGLAIEAAVALPQHGIDAEFTSPKINTIRNKTADSPLIAIKNDPALVRRICAVVMDVTLKDSPQFMKDRLESSDIRSLNNLIDITNYVMRLTGHPTHVFDYDRLTNKQLIIRESKKGEKITTLDNKTYTLSGGDIVADNGDGEIIDLLGIMGTANSVVTNETKRILFFIDNLDPHRIRKTSMSLGIRTDAAVLNEKDIDPSIAMDALLHGMALFKDLAGGKIISDVIDIYPAISLSRTILLNKEKLAKVIGVPIASETATSILEKLSFSVKEDAERFTVEVPSWRKDLEIQEDLIEEIARIYGYHTIPSALAPLGANRTAQIADTFYWEHRVKEALKYWGFSEVYTYAMVSEDLFEGDLSEAVTVANPLNEDMVYMRKTLVPSLLQVIRENPTRDTVKIFEIANVYLKRNKDLPEESLRLAGVVKKPNVSFFEVKGLFEQLFHDLGIQEYVFKPLEHGNSGAKIYFTHQVCIGTIEIIDDQTIDFELDFSVLVQHATTHKTYTSLPKYPPIIEDMSFIFPTSVTVGDVEGLIKKQSNLIKHVTLFDKYGSSRTFKITYQHADKNLTNEDIVKLREKIIHVLKEKLQVRFK
jgi:phenylalanyl-tRNA synthetase beta chain